jgi:fructose-1-phosphate kinase PfkB-like protein
MSKSVALITVNPTVDVLFQGEDFSFNRKTFVEHSRVAVGGLAVNVARGLQALRHPFGLYTVFGGDTGRLANDLLVKERIPFRLTENDAETRVTAISTGGTRRSMLVAPSPRIRPATIKKFIRDHRSDIAKHRLVLVGGSVPEECTEHLISDLLRPLIGEGVRVIVDSRGSFAQRAHEEIPYAVKYNEEKASNAIQNTPKANQSIRMACDLHKKGSSLVIYNRRKHCYAIYNGSIWHHPYYEKFVKPTYGRGDAFLAGLTSALADERGFHEAIRFAIACATSFTCVFPLGEIDRGEVSRYFGRIQCDTRRRIR